MRRGPLSLLALLLAATTACGTTVPLQSSRASGDGLTPQGQQQPGGSAGGGLAPGTSPTTGLGSSTTGSGPLGGGTGGSTGGAATGTSGATRGGGATTGTGVRSRGPIQVGFVTTSVGNAAALGVNAGQTYTDKALYDALVKEYNAAGGLAGRRIEPVYGDTDTASSNWSNDFAAVCSKFTEDNKVKAVIGYVFVYIPSFEQCLAKKGVAHLYGGYQPGDVVAQGDFPTFVATGHPTVDGANLAAFTGALQSGLITRSTRIGLVIDSCANGDRAFSRSTEPWLKAQGLQYETVQLSCAQGASDASGGASAVSAAVLRFNSNGVKVVFAFGVALLVFMQQAESQGYKPQYLTTVGGAALQDNAPQEAMKRLHGFGWMPAVDVAPAQQPYPKTPAQQACLAKLAKNGLRPAAYNDFMFAYQACDGLELYAKALAAADPSDAAGVVAQVLRAMPTYAGAGTYGGALRATSYQRGGPATMREFGWDDGCGCLTYRGKTYPIPAP